MPYFIIDNSFAHIDKSNKEKEFCLKFNDLGSAKTQWPFGGTFGHHNSTPYVNVTISPGESMSEEQEALILETLGGNLEAMP